MQNADLLLNRRYFTRRWQNIQYNFYGIIPIFDIWINRFLSKSGMQLIWIVAGGFNLVLAQIS